MQRIAVIGPPGAGKSTLARRLGQCTGLPVHHLDRLYWLPGWIERPREEFRAMQAEITQRGEWIIDGNYSNTLDLRLARADTIIFLDFSRCRCLWRVIKRWWTYRDKQRPDIASGCPEKIDWAFIKWIWTYPDRHKDLLEYLESAGTYEVIHLRSPGEVDRFLAGLK